MRQRALNEILRKYGVKIAYLFGSRQAAGLSFLNDETGEFEQGSDLDIGLVFEQLPRDVFGVYGELYAALSLLFEPFTVDPVFLQETSPLFQYEAVCGKAVFCANEDFRDEYEERVMKTASDLFFKKAEFEKDFLEAVKYGYFEIARR